MPGGFADEVAAEETNSELRDALRRANRDLRKSKERSEDLVKAVHQAAYDATLAEGPIALVPVPAIYSTALFSEEWALWDTGDWQGSKVTPTYNRTVAKNRVESFVRKSQAITAQRRSGSDIKNCVILFGGDMIEGISIFPGQEWEVDGSLFEQYVWVSRLVVWVVQSALATYEKVVVSAEWGNHGRIGSKRDSVPRSDNFDRMIYHLAKELLSDEIDAGRLVWPESEEDIQRVEVGNYRALNLHGDEVGRGGVASPSTLTRFADRWKSGAFRFHGEFWDFRDVYIHHLHTHAEYPMANGDGAVYQTGSTESDNRYARDSMAASAIPSQRLHFIDPIAGKVTAQFKVYLDD